MPPLTPSLRLAARAAQHVAVAPRVSVPLRRYATQKGAAAGADAAPPGTVFVGLSVYKDKPDPVARPDSGYPAWLWELLDDPAIVSGKALATGDVDTTGMSKGEARAALKRSAKTARAAVRKQKEMEEKEAARRERMSSAEQDAAAATAVQAAEDALPKTPLQHFEHARTVRRGLRKQNRAAIKASNFVRST
ncbi:hypothetical protein MSPP1_001867 [Malassezia sp. CBS 17886]|nr:hypothetical protein MSPP1_001867 [Malassezia sp. CBS 17886]